ncbi:sodium/hydrogen exchanger 8 isoform X1 [Vicugna pacos]|uniref:Sodium/hydrogen exchanger n=3 Tax=Camelidae TaxID=9835 RepID=A0A6J3B912_VICPA|nr:sodium/hydrogen exchanger 8 isoform X1 [Camelus dromedarius]XP_031543565.1 sodium/hydrogen exchanger 8 isoform X1 [Vicugna pacos]XP_045375260.1 sodium/hydrogen exchanger 8 isoform X1 [Camelus bactrianus]
MLAPARRAGGTGLGPAASSRLDPQARDRPPSVGLESRFAETATPDFTFPVFGHLLITERSAASSRKSPTLTLYIASHLLHCNDHFRFPNTTHEGFNVTLHTTLVVTTKLVLPTPAKPILPVQTGEQAQQEEQSSGMTIFFSLLVLAICIILVHLLIRYRLHFLPESVAVVSLGILMGAVIKIIEFKKLANWKEEEMFRPNMFFLLLLPPIIFESGYSLHKGNFFQNIGSITLFAVFGTAISAFVVGGGIYFLGQADVISKLNMTDSFAFGSLISAVDPVATIAIFNALHVDPVLNMLVFGESILNDAVSIVLTNTAEGLTRKNVSDVSGWQTFLQALGYFLKMFFGSAALGTLTGLISALVLKHIDLRKTPSLEFGMMIIFAYLPYGLAEGISLSGIMAILFSGIVMSHYTHHNLSPVTQILMQQTLRTVAFLCETCVFAFLGLSIFSFPHKFEISFVIWCIVLVLFGRAVNIFPLSYLLNFFRDHKITPKMMFIMWFSGLRGAIPYALSLHLDLEPMEKRQLIGTTTIIIVLFTILLLGGSTMPLIRLMDIEDAKARRRSKKDVNLSKTEKMGNTIESEHLSELTEEEYEAHYIKRQDLKGFLWLDAKYLNPFFTRRLTQEDLHHGRIQMKTLTNKWYEEVRQGPSGSEDDEQELL